MVTFDASFTLYPVRIDSTLQKACRARLFCFSFKDPDKTFANCFTFLLRISDPGKCGKEFIACFNYLEPDITKDFFYPFSFSFSHKAGIDIDRDQPVPDCQGGKRRTY